MSSTFKKRPRYLSLDRKVPEGAFRHVVIPRYSVLFEESKQALPVSHESLHIGGDQFGPLEVVVIDSGIEGISPFPVFSEVPLLQSVPLDIGEHGSNERANVHDKLFKGGVKWVTPEVIVEITDEMDEALLLATGDGVIAPIEVRYEDTPVAGQHLMDDSRFSCSCHPEEDVRAIREDPDIMVRASNTNLRLIDMDKGTAKHCLDDFLLGLDVVLGKVAEKAKDVINV